MLSTNESLQINWTLGGVIAWVLFRNLEYAQAYSEETKTAAYLAIYGAMPSNKGDERTPPQMSFKDACRSILRELEKGTLASTGTRRELMPREEIPARDWINNEFSFDPDKATILKEDSSFGRTSWGALRFPVQSVLALWPSHESPNQITTTSQSEKFSRLGNVWHLIFNGQAAYIGHAKGFLYIQHLLINPYQEFSIEEIEAHLFPGKISASNVEYLNEQDGFSTSEIGLDSSDRKTKAAIDNEIENLLIEIESAKEKGLLEEQEKLEGQLTYFTNYLSANFNIKGKPRKTSDQSEKLRKSIKNSISRAISKIQLQLPDLANYLSANLSTGKNLAFKPPQPTNWS